MDLTRVQYLIIHNLTAQFYHYGLRINKMQCMGTIFHAYIQDIGMSQW